MTDDEEDVRAPELLTADFLRRGMSTMGISTLERGYSEQKAAALKRCPSDHPADNQARHEERCKLLALLAIELQNRYRDSVREEEFKQECEWIRDFRACRLTTTALPELTDDDLQQLLTADDA